MTVALNDVVMLSELLGDVRDFSDWDEVGEMLHKWHWGRKPLSSTINILSVALYDLFGADGKSQSNLLTGLFADAIISIDEELAVLRRGCFKYFERGGECVNGPVSLLSGFVTLLFDYHV